MTRRRIIQLLSCIPAIGLLPQFASAGAGKGKGHDHGKKGHDHGKGKKAEGKAAAGGKPANLMGEGEPLAKAMKYKHDANAVKGIRTNKKAFCNNCDRWNKCNETDKACKTGADANAAYNPCNLFPGKTVANKGWCLSWQAKS